MDSERHTSRGQVGHGPGWHSSEHVWPQPPRSRPHVSPQVCGASHGSAAGSICAALTTTMSFSAVQDKRIHAMTVSRQRNGVHSQV